MRWKLTTESFIERALSVHGNRYDYSETVYEGGGMESHINIICPKHGKFRTMVKCHLKGALCKACANEKKGDKSRHTLEDFLERARKKHGDAYDYSEVEFVDNNTKVSIRCKKHDIKIWQTPKSHKKYTGCPMCTKEIKSGQGLKDTAHFITRARTVHGDRYDYSESVYSGFFAKVTIKCPKHGKFQQRASDHYSGRGCHKCGVEAYSQKLRIAPSTFFKKCRKVHGDRYDYSETVYTGAAEPITFRCPLHGEITMLARDHLSHKHGCKVCGYKRNAEARKLPFHEFLKRAKEMHGDKYDYSSVIYDNYNSDVTIICPKHGPFEQTPATHLFKGCGCAKCGYEANSLRYERRRVALHEQAKFLLGITDKKEK
jgi:hypothetical protein